ncbi:sulfite exporter TauE/SafE family protein [Aestuariicella sp. G3-2]|uniref:sulfite exporter TauE/SafE family protein n=1 Tax=Pseudomaricurvus albidus TaxID=2842452 RepID=UPI001C0CE640|nr:sulfite exporter TauE/SafE family protein [Aestuariicella albida]MBU3070935.1 sulfite exporter TauE/SafE family protein [Aestuariicella albida]
MALLILTGLCVGLVLGLTGAGGSILAVPLLLLTLDLSLNDTIGIALGAVCAAATIGVLQRWRQRSVDPVVGVMLALSGMATAPAGRWLGMQIPETLLMTAFAVLAGFLAWRMWCGSSVPNSRINSKHNVTSSWQLFVIGAGCGLLSGLFGVGGGFVIVPALTLLLGMSMQRAIATSLLVIAMISASGFVFQLSYQKTAVTPLLLCVVGSVAGITLSTLLARHIPTEKLQKLFALSVAGLLTATVSKMLS